MTPDQLEEVLSDLRSQLGFIRQQQEAHGRHGKQLAEQEEKLLRNIEAVEAAREALS